MVQVERGSSIDDLAALRQALDEYDPLGPDSPGVQRLMPLPQLVVRLPTAGLGNMLSNTLNTDHDRAAEFPEMEADYDQFMSPQSQDLIEQNASSNATLLPLTYEELETEY